MLKVYTIKIHSLCSQLITGPDNAPFCGNIHNTLVSQIRELENKNALLKPVHTRSKRGYFDGVGTLSKTLFGTLNEDDAIALHLEIETLASNEKHINQLLRNQTLILDSTLNIYNKTGHEIAKQFKAIQEKLQQLTNKNAEKTVLTTELDTLISFTVLLTIKYQNIQNELLKQVTEVKHGKPSPSILSISQIREALSQIQKEIPASITLPISNDENDALQIFRLGQMSAAVINSKIIFEFKIPLPFKENYQLLHLIPFPTFHENSFAYIEPSIKYLIVDSAREHYCPLTEIEIDKCITTKNNLYLCKLTHPIYNILPENNICETELLIHVEILPHNCLIKITEKKNYWFSLSNTNHWLYSLPDEQKIYSVCNNSMKSFYLSHSGMIKIPNSCYIKSKGYTIQANNAKTTSIFNHFIPSINLTEFLKLKPNTTKLANQTFEHIILKEEVESIKNQIELQKKRELEFEEHKNNHILHNVHHYTVPYIIFTIIIITAVILKLKKKPKGSPLEIRGGTTLTTTELVGINLKSNPTSCPPSDSP